MKKKYYLKFKNSYNFLKFLETEIKKSSEIYGKEDSKWLKRYYFYVISKDKNYCSFAFYYTALRQMHLLKYIEKGTKILDAGCGTGSDAILCGIYGGEVLGIDISDQLLKLTKKRTLYYEKIFNTKLIINFKVDNIFNVSGLFNIIWVNEAISHIDPFEDFIRLCFNKLKKGGRLIIAENNKLNPISFYKAKKAQRKKGGIITIRKDPKTGKNISYANERIFTIYQIKSLSSKIFKNIEIYPIGYIPFFVYNKLPKISRIFEENILHHIPIIKSFSGSYVIICTKI